MESKRECTRILGLEGFCVEAITWRGDGVTARLRIRIERRGRTSTLAAVQNSVLDGGTDAFPRRKAIGGVQFPLRTSSSHDGETDRAAIALRPVLKVVRVTTRIRPHDIDPSRLFRVFQRVAADVKSSTNTYTH